MRAKGEWGKVTLPKIGGLALAGMHPDSVLNILAWCLATTSEVFRYTFNGGPLP